MTIKKIICLLLVLSLCLLMLFACGGGTTDGGTDDGNEDGTNDGTSDENPDTGTGAVDGNGFLYKSGVPVRIVTPEGSSLAVSEIFKAINRATGKAPAIVTDKESEEKHEIAVGDTSRLVTSRANRAIRVEGLDEWLDAWCIYVNNDSVAIVATDPTLLPEAIEYFVSEHLTSDSLEVDDGVIKMEIVDFKARAEAEEAKIRESELLAIEEILGKDAADAMREYLAVYDDDFYRWLAGLYDPETGALYYSNSARDTYGFLPDLESTSRGYGWLTGVGMLDNYNGSLKDALPDWLVEKLIKWTQGLQSSRDGFFYHPQWGKEITTDRRGRDLSSAVSFLTRLGGDILYDTPSGEKGVLGAPTGALLAPLGGGAKTAVSKVVSAASVVDHLSSPEKFRAYLEGLDWGTGSTYVSGSRVQSQTSQIKSAGPEIIAVFEDFLNEKQEAVQETLRDNAEAALLKSKPSATAEEIAAARKAAENGLWDTKHGYESVNGLMKIASTYHSLGVKINYANAAFRSAVEIIMIDSVEVGAVVNIFNPWVMLDTLQSNIRKFGSSDEVLELRSYIRENAAEMISKTAIKIAAFKKADGSFGYNADKGQSTSQSAHVSTGVNEGDVNGATIATTSIFSHICSALGIPRPHMYFPTDFEKFIEIIENAEPIDKPPFVAEPEDNYERFDYYKVGDAAPSAGGSMQTGSLTIVKDPRAGSSGNVIEYVTRAGANSEAQLKTKIASDDPDLFILEFEMNLLESKSNTTVMQIRLASCYMLTVKTTADGIKIGDSSSTDGKVALTKEFDGTYAYGEWHTYRIELDVSNENAPVAKIYVDGKLVDESGNFYGKTAEGGTPNLDYSVARFFALQSAEVKILFDNILAEQTKAQK